MARYLGCLAFQAALQRLAQAQGAKAERDMKFDRADALYEKAAEPAGRCDEHVWLMELP